MIKFYLGKNCLSQLEKFNVIKNDFKKSIYSNLQIFCDFGNNNENRLHVQ